MTPQRADAVGNRDRILAAARVAVGQAHDGETLRLNAIAKAAGVGQGTLYRHFPTREALLVEVYRQDVEKLSAAATALLQEHPPVEAIRRWFDRLADYARVKRGVLDAVQATSRVDLLAHGHGSIDSAIGQLLDAGRAAGAIREDVHSRDVVLLVGFLTRLTEAERDVRARHLLGLVLDSLRAPAPPAATPPAG